MMGIFLTMELGFFSRIYLDLVIEVNKRLCIDCLGFMVVNKINKHLMGPNKSNLTNID